MLSLKLLHTMYLGLKLVAGNAKIKSKAPCILYLQTIIVYLFMANVVDNHAYALLATDTVMCQQ
jgi:hypothetical protein